MPGPYTWRPMGFRVPIGMKNWKSLEIYQPQGVDQHRLTASERLWISSVNSTSLRCWARLIERWVGFFSMYGGSAWQSANLPFLGVINGRIISIDKMIPNVSKCKGMVANPWMLWRAVGSEWEKNMVTCVAVSFSTDLLFMGVVGLDQVQFLGCEVVCILNDCSPGYTPVN